MQYYIRILQYVAWRNRKASHVPRKDGVVRFTPHNGVV